MLDLTLSGMYGLDVLKKLREMDAGARVIIATADIQTTTREMAAEAGALGLVIKPFESGHVLEAVDAALKGVGQ